MSETRRSIERHVRCHPGVHFSGLVDRLGLAPGQVQHHLRRLTTAGRVVAERLYGRTHYFPDGFDQWERRALAVLRRETSGDVVGYLLVEGPARPGEVTAAVDIARSTLAYHVDRLEAEGLVEKSKPAPNRVALEVSRPEATVRLLRRADPTLGARLVDRFSRLVDQLLADAGGTD